MWVGTEVTELFRKLAGSAQALDSKGTPPCPAAVNTMAEYLIVLETPKVVALLRDTLRANQLTVTEGPDGAFPARNFV